MFLTSLYSNSILVNLFEDGGTLFMSLILISFLLSIFFIVKGFLKLNADNSHILKMIKLAKDFSYLGLVIGFLGSMIGLISAFDAIESLGNVAPSMVAGGLKVALLTSTFGLSTAALSRVGIIGLRFLSKV